MRKFLLFVILVLFPVTFCARQQAGSKVVGLARKALMEQNEKQKKVTTRSAARLQSRNRLTAFVRMSSPKADEVLNHHGCRKLAQWSDAYIVDIPLEALATLAAEPSVRRIEAGPSASLTMDTIRRVVNALPVYEPASQHAAYTGAGVVVGVMDVGFDLMHPTFYNTTGSQYRIGAFWDQISSDTIGSRMSVGRDFVGFEAVAACGHATDAGTENHGNHTVGIAAGSGFTSPYKGVAYESDICLVSNAISSDTIYIAPKDYYKYTTATDALGFKYMFDYADSIGKPCVVSFSEGYDAYLDGEDSLYAAFIDSLISIPGHILVSSAGNNGEGKTYAEKPVGIQQMGTFLKSWHKDVMCKLKADGPLCISLDFYDKVSGTIAKQFKVFSDNLQLDSLLTDTVVVDNDTCEIKIERYASSFAAGDTIYILALKASKEIVRLAPIAVVVEGLSTYAEVFGNSKLVFTEHEIEPRWDAAQYGHNIMAPACFPGVICVGSTSHRVGVNNYKGDYKTVGTAAQDGLRTYFSSTGPSMNGLMKPEVMAPGLNVVSAYSRYYLDEHPTEDDYVTAFSEFQQKQYPWVINSGTSMSAPVVAGVIALWLQAVPQLTQQEVMGVISRTCRQPDASLAYPNNTYGYGEIDAHRGLMDLLHLDKIEGLSMTKLHGIQIRPQGKGVQLQIANPSASTLSMKVYNLDGHCISTTHVNASSKTVYVALPLVSHGVYAVQVEDADMKVCGSQLVRF